MTALILSLMTSQALAWESLTPKNWALGTQCSTPFVITGHTHEWHNFAANGTMTEPVRAAVEQGAEVTNGGPGTVNRGVDWTWVRGTDQAGLQSLTNTTSEAWHITQSEGVNLFGIKAGWAGFAAISADVLCISTVAVDVVFDSDRSWTTALPSQRPSGTLSMAPVAAHEFAHAIGFGHTTTSAAIMRRRQMAELGDEVRLHEDDYAGLSDMKPGPGNGKNFMLGKWREDGPGARDVEEIWTTAEDDDWLAGACGVVAAADGPRKIFAAVNGTASSYTVDVEWALSSDKTCFSPDDITIGTRSPTMSSNTAYMINPSSDEYVIPSHTPDGLYYVCATINPGLASEAQSSYGDNTIVSEGRWDIDCP